jgi:hypothetical protein
MVCPHDIMKESKSKHLHMDTTHSRKKQALHLTYTMFKRNCILELPSPLFNIQSNNLHFPSSLLITSTLTFYACGGNAQNLGGGVIHNFKRKI